MNINDARAKYTEKVIREQFLALVKEKPIAKIKVTELCERCGINRATFYKHFIDIYDLLEKMEKDMLDSLAAYTEPDQFDNLETMFRRLYEGTKKYGYEWLVLYGENGDPTLSFKMRKLMEERCYPHFENVTADLSETERKYLYQFLSGGSLSIIASWIQTGMKEPVEDMAKVTVDTLNKTMNHH